MKNKKVVLLTFISIFMLSVKIGTQFSVVPVTSFGEANVLNNQINSEIASSKTIWVPDNYTKIQWAVGNATSGETIFVRAGIYNERVTIDKSLTLIGENPSTTIINGSSGRYVIKCFSVSRVYISGFTIKMGIYGINITSSTNITISGNIITNNIGFGIFLEFSNNNSVCDNRVLSNGDRGIYIRFSNNNFVNNNTVSNHNQWGIYLYRSGNNVVSNNSVSNNKERGIYQIESNNNVFSGNTISNNAYGISIWYSAGNTLRNNKMNGNRYSFDISAFALGQYTQDIDSSNTVNGKPMYYWINQANKQVPPGAGYVAVINSKNITLRDQTLTNNGQGVLFAYTTNSTIMNVNASHNSVGICIVDEQVWDEEKQRFLSPSGNNVINSSILANNYWSGIEFTFSSDNIFTGNTVINNYYGVSCAFCNNTLYHNNFLDNINLTYRSVSRSIINVWDNGYPSGGNYWSDYEGKDLYSGPYQSETGGDGIGDTPYVIDADNIDNYPLMNPWGQIPPYGPTADFTYVPLSPLPNETVTFDASASQPGFNGTHFTSIVSYAWNFSDGTSIVITTGPTTTHKFTAEGNYTVTLNVTDTQGLWNTTSKRVTVLPAGVPRGPTAYFAYEPKPPPEDREVTFNATLSAPGWNGSYVVLIANYTWNFGDTNVTTTIYPVITHIYPEPGEYNVTLTVTCEDDPELIAQNLTSDTTWRIVTVLDETPPTIGGIVQSPAASEVDSDETVSVTAINVTDNVRVNLVLLRYSTDNKTFTNVIMSQVSGTNNYTGQIPVQASETYVTYMVYAWDNSGNFKGTAIYAYRVKDATPPFADAGPNQIVNEDTLVTFDGSNSYDDVGIINYIWTFTDVTLQTLTDINPTYNFTNPGVFIVTLNVSDAAGNWDTDTVTITVRDVTPPVADAGPYQTVDEDTVVIFDGSGSRDNVGIVNYTWTFRDVTPRTLTGVSPIYNFTNPGFFLVTLNVSDAAGNWATDFVLIMVLDITPPVADAGSDQTVRVGTTVTFNGSGSTDNVGIVSYKWDFGDGNVTTVPGPTLSHTYVKSGTFNVTLTVEDEAGNIATDSITVTVVPAPFPWWIMGVLVAAGIVAAIVIYLVKIRKPAKRSN